MMPYGQKIRVSTAGNDVISQSSAEIAEMIKRGSALPQGDEIWVSSYEKPYPCLSILVKGKYACVHYFQNDEGDGWQSRGDFNEEVTFLAGGGEWTAPGSVIIPLEKAVRCMEEFRDTLERPRGIEWEALWEEA